MIKADEQGLPPTLGGHHRRSRGRLGEWGARGGRGGYASNTDSGTQTPARRPERELVREGERRMCGRIHRGALVPHLGMR